MVGQVGEAHAYVPTIVLGTYYTCTNGIEFYEKSSRHSAKIGMLVHEPPYLL